MELLRAVKIRLYPNRDQATLLAKTLGCKRFIWNQMLADRQAWYREHGTSIGKSRKTEKEWKVLYPFLRDVDSIALQQARIDLDTAHVNFFAGRAKFPRFKSKHGDQSYRTINVNGNVQIDPAHRKIKLPKLGWITYRDTRVITGTIKSVTVSKTKSGRYFMSILVNQDLDIEQKTTVNESSIAAFDMSAKDFLVSDTERYNNPRFYRNSETKLARLHRRVSRKVKGSANRDKARVRLARLYERIGNQRTDWLQKLSTILACSNDAIVIEDLNIEGMKRWNGGLAKSITLDFAWSTFVQMLDYKLSWRGKYLVKVDRFFPSSQLCSACGYQHHELVLGEREWACPACGARHDRDINAAKNIKREGIRLLRENNITVINSDGTAGTAESHASGDLARPVIPMAEIGERRIRAL